MADHLTSRAQQLVEEFEEGGYLDDNALSIIRCAVEALPND